MANHMLCCQDDALSVPTLTTFINGLMFKVFQSVISTHVLKARARKELSGDAH
jgi:hypothetical protein